MAFCRVCRRHDHWEREHDWWALERALDPDREEMGVIPEGKRVEKARVEKHDKDYLYLKGWREEKRNYYNEWMAKYMVRYRARKKRERENVKALRVLREGVRADAHKVGAPELSKRRVPRKARSLEKKKEFREWKRAQREAKKGVQECEGGVSE